ncbi:hypothetical protein [Bacillus sp. WMMC1349]|uniref:hypothetical protein n=1 Tax=Bacillus sp. WMMC1349 TaxID=2736254 RepID=UPI0020A642A3|nr:hypothetical protein [Bacillus sp. WMMC1349]
MVNLFERIVLKNVAKISSTNENHNEKLIQLLEAQLEHLKQQNKEQLDYMNPTK